MEFAKNMYELHKRVSPTEVIIGWYVSQSNLDMVVEGNTLFSSWSCLSSQVCNRLWHHRTLSAHPWVLQPWGLQPHSLDDRHSTSEWQDEHPRLRQVHRSLSYICVLSFRLRLWVWTCLFLLHSAQMGVPGKTVGVMFTPLTVKYVYYDTERIGGKITKND